MCFHMTTGMATQIDTLFYDSNRKGVESALYSHYYKIMTTPDNPKFQKRFKDYSINGTLLAEGVFISIDKYDDSKSILDGQQIRYYDNGNVKCEFNYHNGKLYGTMKEYNENGELNIITTYENGIKNGEQTYYYNNGNPQKITPYHNDKINGTLQEFNESGIPIYLCEYDNGLEIGKYESRTGTSIYKGLNKEITQSQIPLIRISCSISQFAVPVKEATLNLLIFTPWGKLFKDKYIDVTNFTLNLQNLSNNNISCKIDNVKIEYLQKDKFSQNMALLEKDAIDLLQKSAAYIVKSAYQEANQVAYNAATQSSYSSSSNTTTSKADVNIQNNSSSKASAAGAAVVGTATVVAATAATTKTDSQTSGTINQRHTSTSSTTTTTTDGYLRYQVYQQEKTKADSVAKKNRKCCS